VTFSPYMMPTTAAWAPDMTVLGGRPSGFAALAQGLSHLSALTGMGGGAPMAALGPSVWLGPTMAGPMGAPMVGKPAAMAQPGFAKPAAVPMAQPGFAKPAAVPMAQPGLAKPAAVPMAQPGFAMPAAVPMAQPGFAKPAAAPMAQPGFAMPAGLPQPWAGMPMGMTMPMAQVQPTAASYDAMMAQINQGIMQGQAGLSFSIGDDQVLGVSIDP